MRKAEKMKKEIQDSVFTVIVLSIPATANVSTSPRPFTLSSSFLSFFLLTELVTESTGRSPAILGRGRVDSLLPLSFRKNKQAKKKGEKS